MHNPIDSPPESQVRCLQNISSITHKSEIRVERRELRGVREMRRELVRTVVESILILLLGLALIAVSLSTASSAKGATPVGANPYPYPKSTHWAWQNRPDLPANLGLPKEWARAAEAQGWPVGPYPRKGSVAVFPAGVYGADREAGHVAVVERVLDENLFVTSAMDESDCRYSSSTCGRINQREYSLISGLLFIHTKKDTRTTWGFASGASGWTPRDLGAGNTGGPGWFYPLAGADPQLLSPELDVSLEAYNAVEIDMVIGAPVTDPTVQVYFATGEQPLFTEEKAAGTRGKADGQWRTYRAYFGNNPAWKGRLTGLRLDPAGGGTTGGVRVDRVRLVQVEGESETFMTLTEKEAEQTQQPRSKFGPGRERDRL